MSTSRAHVISPYLSLAILLASSSCWAEQPAPGKKFDFPSDKYDYRGSLGLVWKNISVRKAEPNTDLSKRRIGYSLDRENDFGLLIATSEDGGVAILDRPRYALASISLYDSSFLVRYHVYSGASWYTSSRTTKWTKIVDETPPPHGLYEIRLEGPFREKGGDKKDSFTITRIERNTGKCWWRNKGKWQQLIEPDEETTPEAAPDVKPETTPEAEAEATPGTNAGKSAE